MRTFVVVTFRLAGTHRWSGCNIAAVRYLKDEHRHQFHFKAEKEVSHNDRQIEILTLQKAMVTKIISVHGVNADGCVDFGGQSCEQIAAWLMDEFQLHSCEVLEDGENGARVEA